MLRWLRQMLRSETEVVKNDDMKYLVVGLGNMGAEYDNTRHNIGFDVVDHLADRFEVKWKNEQLGDITEFRHRSRTYILLKPSTYMNLSGKAVRYWLQKKKVDKDRLLVIVDDLNLDFSTLRLRTKGSAGGHNGLKSIDQLCGGNNYARLRVGIGNNFSRGRQVDFVLGKWDSDERTGLPDLVQRAGDAVLDFGVLGAARAMDKHNKSSSNKTKDQ